MTRNEAIRLLAREALLMFEHDGSSTLDGDTTLHIINQIFDEHGEHLMDRGDEIELLKHRVEELIKPKTCEGCKHSKVTISSVICGKNGTYKEADDYCKYFMPKDNV